MPTYDTCSKKKIKKPKELKIPFFIHKVLLHFLKSF